MTPRTEQRLLWAVVVISLVLGGLSCHLARRAALPNPYLEACGDGNACNPPTQPGDHG